jgi:hypothetical protein
MQGMEEDRPPGGEMVRLVNPSAATIFRVDNGTGRGPIKDTVLVEPMQRLTVE